MKDRITGSFHEFPPLEPFYFDRCPICLVGPADSAEDVPPRSISGTVLTRTCRRCNNELGAKIDRHLAAFCGDEVLDLRVVVQGVQGVRKVGRAAIRRTEGGTPIIIPREREPSNVRAALNSGAEMRITYSLEPDQARVKLGILKSAYLAGCVGAQTIIDSPTARRLRAEILAARDAPSTAVLKVRTDPSFRSGPGEQTRMPTSFYMDGEEIGISLARVLFVEWPLSDVPPPIERYRTV